jgi:hypothetical protein
MLNLPDQELSVINGQRHHVPYFVHEKRPFSREMPGVSTVVRPQPSLSCQWIPLLSESIPKPKSEGKMNTLLDNISTSGNVPVGKLSTQK